MTEDKKKMRKKKSDEEILRERQLRIERDHANKQMLHKVFAERLEKLCDERGYTSYELSFKAAVPETTLRHMITGESNNPTLYNIMKICDGLDMTLAEFFNTQEFVDVMIESRNEN